MGPELRDPMKDLRVLVVEDETLIAEELRERLTRRGAAAVEVVDTGEGAIRAAEEGQPQLILMDIRLKGRMDGIEAAKEIRGRTSAPLVFLTAHSDDATVGRAQEAEPFGYVLKPFSEQQLVVALDLCLQRHRLEERLRRSERRYAATLSSIGDGVIATDEEGRVTFMNPVAEGLVGWSTGEAQGLGIEDVLPTVSESTGEPFLNPLLQALGQERAFSPPGSTVALARGRERIPIESTATPILDDEGRLQGAVIAFRDDRPRRRAQEAQDQAERHMRQMEKLEALGRLAGGIAHDFNNLLTVINGSAEILLDSEGLEASFVPLLQHIRKAGQRAAGMTRQLLAFSRKQVPEPIPLDLGELVADISVMLGRLIGDDVTLETHYQRDLARIQADPHQLEQVILNLAVNARDAMPGGGRLRLSTRNAEVTAAELEGRPELAEGSYVVLEVRDTGAGMDEETMRRAFEPFFTTKEEGKGTGMGLATVFGVVKNYQGFVELDSEVGEGTVFRLYFPAVTTPPVEGCAKMERPAVGKGGRETILLVEDDGAVRSLVARALTFRGYRVIQAGDGAEALQVFDERADEIELLVTDVVMPGMNGRELSEALRESKPSLQVLFLSGYNEDRILQESIHKGEAAFLQKPFRPAALTQKVRELLDE